jgi:Fe-S oxidoreductase
MGPAVTLAMLAAAAAVFAFTMHRRLAPLLALRRERRTDRVGERLGLLIRFGLGQRRLVDREELWPGLLHVAIFAAFLVLAARTITLFGRGFSAGYHLPLLDPGTPFGRAYGLVTDGFVLVALLAALAFLWRRLVSRPDRVTRSAGGIVILLLIVGLATTDLLVDRAPGLVGQAAFWTHLALILVFGNLLPYGKHFHVLTALPNVFFARLPPAAALAPLELEAEEARLGTATVADLSWKDAWDVYSCTECGRCETHCPTHLTGKPLSHQEVNRALRRHLAEAAPALAALARARNPAAREAALAGLPPITSVVKPETAWACTTCGWCETACPVLIENVPRLVDIRRHQVLAAAKFPPEARRVFQGIETQGNPWGLGSNRRTDWCEGLDVPRAASGRPFEWLFFVGCAGAYDERQMKVSRAIVALLRRARVSFAILGEEETCTGDAARRLGNEYLFQAQARALVEVLSRRGVKKILVQCPHCLNTLASELPAFGGRFEVVHHAELLARLSAEGRLPCAPRPGATGPVTFHDPCYLARLNGVAEPPRDALRAAGARLLEMPRNRRQGFCCGAGGGRFWLEEKLGTRVSHHRVAEAAATLGEGGGVIATGCPFCLAMLGDGVAETGCAGSIRVMDVAELAAQGLSGERP